MAIVIEALQMERLAQQLAKAEGVPVSEVVRESLLSLAGIRGSSPRNNRYANGLASWRAKSMHWRNLHPATVATTTSRVMTSTAVSHPRHDAVLN